MLYIGVEIPGHSGAGLVDSSESAKQRCLIVKRFSCIGYEYGRDTQGIVNDECRR